MHCSDSMIQEFFPLLSLQRVDQLPRALHHTGIEPHTKMKNDTFLVFQTMQNNNQGPDFDDISSSFPCEIDYQYIKLGYGEQAPKIVIL